jgi:hypothetical protein
MMAARNQRLGHRQPWVPIHAHALDPAAVYQRAAEIGQAAADAGGALNDATVAHLIAVLVRAATALGYLGDPAGLRTRLWWTVRDAAAARERATRDTERDVRRATIRAIVAGLPLEAALEAARQANLEADPSLPDRDVATIARTEIAIEARRAGCDCCSRARPGRG